MYVAADRGANQAVSAHVLTQLISRRFDDSEALWASPLSRATIYFWLATALAIQ
jgi:hypothetical protein